MRGRPGIGRLLASSSVAALLIGGGAPPALAACVVINAPFDNPAGNTIQCVQLDNTAITGNISNEGTITGTISGAISLTAGTIAGEIIDSGTILGGGIAVDQTSQITGFSAIKVTGPTFAGGVANAGTIAGSIGIVVGTFGGSHFVTTFSGGISNSGTIFAGQENIILANVLTFTGGITNSGVLTGAPSDAGIFVRDTSVFSGDIVNQASGSITAAAGEGISVNRVATFAGGITNLGTVSAGSTGIGVFEVATFTGTISNGGTLSGATGIGIIGSTIIGRIVDSGVLSGSNIGIAIDGGSKIVAAATAIVVTGPSLAGGVSNGGIVTAGNIGILLQGVTSFGGGIINTGTVTAGQSAIAVTNVATFTGNISNGGTLSAANGIVIAASTITGSIIDTGNVLATGHGIAIDHASVVAGSQFAVEVTGPTFTGGINNAGTLSATVGGGDGIDVFQTSTFTGGIANTGTITAPLNGAGIAVINVATFTGGISNNGTVTGGAEAIEVFGFGGATTFSGGITNTGMLHANVGIVAFGITQFSGGIGNGGTITGGAGILADNAIFTGGISNSGTIAVSGDGIRVAFSVGAMTMTSFSGGIVNTGTIAAGDRAIFISAIPTFAGNISNGGTLAGANGIVIAGSTIAGSIIDTGIVLATSSGVSIDSASVINSTRVGVSIAGATFTGGLTNAGTVAAAQTAIALANVATFTGNISNAGTLSAANGIVIAASTITGTILDSGNVLATGHGIAIDRTSVVAGSQFAVEVTGPTFTGGINNAGMLTATVGGGDGIDVFQTSTFTGGIANTGTITAPLNGAGIAVINVATFAGGISNNGTITGGAEAIEVFGFGGATTFSGGITNTGMLHANVGIVAFGITQFSGGIGNGGTITGGAGILADNAIFTGGISNSGTIAVSGDGIRVAFSVGSMTMTSFSGGIVNTGTIAAANDAISFSAIPTFAGNISNAGTLSAANGIVVGAGVTFTGGAAIVNSGNIMGTTAAIDVSAATSPVTIDQTAGQITGAIKLSANADFLNVMGGTISGNVVGAGSSNTVNFLLGSGSFTYASPFAMTGLHFANFLSGTVFVDGSIAATIIDVNNGGTAAGTGTLSGAVNVLSGGTLMPGQPLGTLNAAGSVTFNAGSIYAVHITPSANSATSITGAPGTAAINGGTVLALPQLGHYNATTYAIVTTSGGVSGTFAGVGFAAPFAFTGSETLTYDADDVFLNLGAGFALLAPAGTNQNQQNVVNGINNFILGSGSNPPPQFANLANLSNPALLNALSQLSGQNAAGFFQGAFQAGNSFLDLMVNPFVDGRFGNGFGPATGFAPNEPPALPQAAAAFASAMPVKAPPPTFDARFSAWGAAYGSSGNVRGDPVVGSSTTTASAAAFAAGMDYRASPDTTWGFALAGGGTNWSLDSALGGGRSDFFQAGLYGSQHWGNAYLSGALAYNFHDVTTNRTVTIAGTDMLQARFQANGVGARIEGGYRYAMPWLGITPYAAAQVQSIYLPSYGETATAGSNQFALNFASQTATATRTELGAWLDHTTLLGRGASLTLYAKLAWAHDFGDTPSASAIFQALPGSNFVVNGAAPARDGGLVTTGARYDLMNGWSFTAKFDGEFSSTTSLYSGTALVRKTW